MAENEQAGRDEPQALEESHLNQSLVISRILGYDEQLKVNPPKSNWSIVTPEHKCWVCDRQIYSVLFWNVEIGEEHSI